MTGIVETVDAGKDGGAAGAGASAGGGAAAGDATKTGSSPDAGAAAAAAAAAETKAGTQTPEQIAAAKTAADAETARVAALTPEAKAAEEKAAKDKAGTDAAPDYTGLKLAEGWTLEQPMVAEALKLFGDNKLAPEAAQALIDFTATRDKALAQALNEHNTQQWETQAAGWKTATEKEFSAEDLGGAKDALAKVFDKDAVAYLEGLKLTSNPGFVRGMVKVFKAIKDDTWVNGNAAGSGAPRDARTHFPKSNMNP